MDTLPRGSNGSNSTGPPGAMTSPPAMYTGIEVLRFAYNAMIGACLDMNMRLRIRGGRTNQNTKNASRSSSQSISHATVVGWKDF